MANYWRQQGIPHKGWVLTDVIDVREDGQSQWETEYETCMMCGNEKIRYVHIVQHDDIADEFRVGCNCAQKMTDDYINPQRRESELRNKASRRINWCKKPWKRTKTGNYYLKIDERFLLIYRDKRTNQYKLKIGQVFGKKSFGSLEKAKMAAFTGMEYLKDKGEW